MCKAAGQGELGGCLLLTLNRRMVLDDGGPYREGGDSRSRDGGDGDAGGKESTCKAGGAVVVVVVATATEIFAVMR